ncbi:hypothetical protein Csa_021023 [Cucumis sativus]|uniref:Uncharacterized protein n=1 Tax=Cucumis sativus TaxID=3659 RepID=A0A0A0KGG5_CUCSA|nr:hypothetical protein Csa_021023 [Cucumis sativus]
MLQPHPSSSLSFLLPTVSSKRTTMADLKRTNENGGLGANERTMMADSKRTDYSGGRYIL